MSLRDTINWKALSKELTGSETKVRKNTSNKYADDVEELMQYIELWIRLKKHKYNK